MTGQRARSYLGIGYHGLTALIECGLVHTNQVTDFAPWRLSRAGLGTGTSSSQVPEEPAPDTPTGGVPARSADAFPNENNDHIKGCIVMTDGGAEGDRTPDLMTASHALSQLSYGPGKIGDVSLAERLRNGEQFCPMCGFSAASLDGRRLGPVVSRGSSRGAATPRLGHAGRGEPLPSR